LPHATTVALSLIAGGGLSNLIDRIAYGGYVIDFLNIGLGGLRTGIFNIADVAIMVGAISLIVRSLRHERRVGF
jgi:signal peptidase II